MINSNAMCHPLCLPFDCREIDSRTAGKFQETVTHYFAEILMVREGTAQILLDHEELTAHSGEAIVICPGARHQVSFGEKDPTRMTLLRMDPDRLAPLPDYSPGLKAILSEARREKAPMLIPAEDAAEMEMPRLTDHCLTETRNGRFGYDYSIAAGLGILCLRVIRFWMERGLKLPRRENHSDPIYSLSGYVQNHLRETLRVEDLAEKCGLSYPWFAKKFREIYGVSCKEYIEQIRVARVEQYLLFTGMDLTQISEATGYADCSHMIKNFKRLRGITPGQYRLQRQKEN